MLDRALLKLTKPAVDGLARQALALGWHADQVTLASLGLGCLASAFIIFGHAGLALAPLLLSRLADGMDGAMARMAGKQTDRGAFLDISLDFVFYACVPLGFAVGNPASNALPAAMMLAAFVTTGTSFLAYATLAAKRGETSTAYPSKGIYYLGGLTEGSETIGVFCLMCLWPGWFGALAYAYAALCALTTATRIKAGWDAFGR
ncbi:MAG: CDP-alcohol phosphatidyltransferase family protein [Alphaproteobacteria bacterium]|nr:CDP-alcohol phosphatidyltransferase family protein [Alphaproteobacteria bacterium]